METQENLRCHEHLIDGESVASERTESIVRLNPATGQPIAQVAAGTPGDADRAIAAARRAFDLGSWPRLSGADRGRVLNRWAALIDAHRDTLARLEVEEVGKPVREARAGICGVVELVEYAAARAHDLHGALYDDFGGHVIGMVSHEPVGVVGVILPWNYPAGLFASTVPYALAAGCTVVVKPSELTSGSALEISRLALEAGLPPGVLNVVTGLGADVGMPLVRSTHVDMVSFTGSTPTGRMLATADAPYPKRVSLELGGKGATVVFADADLDAAVDGTLHGVYANQGETCCAGTRLVIEESIADDFVARLSERAGALRVGAPFDEATDIGALIHEQALERVLRYIEQGVASGARLTVGGGRVTAGGLGNGYFVEPTILDQVPYDSSVFREEIFGPVLSVVRFAAREDAIALANATSYGLANSVWTGDLDTALMLGRALRSGTVWVNTSNDGAPQLPFGGYKASGVGRVKGTTGLQEFIQVKTIHVRIGAAPRFYPRLDVG